MSTLQWGLYEKLVDTVLETRLQHVADGLDAELDTLRPEEAADRLALHLSHLFRRAVASIDSKQRLALGVELAQKIIDLLSDSPHSGVDAGDRLLDNGKMLRAVLSRLPDGNSEAISLPATPLLDTTLLTNAPGEPRVGYQLRSEIPSADRIDVLMAFVRKTGIRPLVDLLQRHCDKGRRLRLVTTTYTGSTELAALEQLRDLGADIRVSYDVSGTRLHAKAWLFHRGSSFSTAYIGSSNLTHSAQVTGLEWNVRVAGARNPDVIEKFSAVFESYWSSEDFRPFDPEEFRELTQTHPDPHRIYLSPIELRPEPFQSRLLEQIELSRLQGHHRNLLVSATGTGKTVMAALDYQRLRQRFSRARLLFVAHRKEMLEQSLATFRHALRDAAFGELWVGNHKPVQFEHVFASIQSISAAKLAHLDPAHFDIVIVDEFHHAAAPTYDSLLTHLTPRELLGLTATPERGDGLSILHWFRNRIAAELRIWDAIEQQRLCPFAYYGISDGIDLRNITWRRGRGYDTGELDQVISGNHVLARLIIKQTLDHVPDPQTMRALGFCVSVKHAQFMAKQFSNAGIPAVAVSGDSSESDRTSALKRLSQGSLRVVFAVDLFNEGIDLPEVDTLLMLRPTDSATIFLQQLGRGLRKFPGKSICTVLDFVSQQRREFQFQRRLGALLGGTRKHLIRQVESGFPLLPSGCHMQLDQVASKNILDNLRENLPSTWNAKAAELRRVADEYDRPTLARFLAATGMALEDVYSGNHSWSDLVQSGGLATLPSGPLEASLRRALGRLLHVDDSLRIQAYREFAQSPVCLDIGALSVERKRLFHMLAVSLIGDTGTDGMTALADAARLLWAHPQVLSELVELMDVLEVRIQHLQTPLDTHPEVPLNVHARYTRREILAAFSDGNELAVPMWREGVKWLSPKKVDLLAFTLDKSSGTFSPTTRYRDYAISRNLIHWESQSTTREGSDTGLRYQQHASLNSTVLLFARMTQSERAFWLLGPATYVSHEGEQPMAIRWRLEQELPGDLYAEFAAAP